MMSVLVVPGVLASLAVVARRGLADGSAVSVRALARRAGLSQSTVANWLDGRRGLSIESLERVRGALGVPWCEVFGCDRVCPACRWAPAMAPRPSRLAA